MWRDLQNLGNAKSQVHLFLRRMTWHFFVLRLFSVSVSELKFVLSEQWSNPNQKYIGRQNYENDYNHQPPQKILGTMAGTSSKKRQGGLKGFLSRAGASFYAGGQLLAGYGVQLSALGAKIGFIVTTSAFGRIVYCS